MAAAGSDDLVYVAVQPPSAGRDGRGRECVKTALQQFCSLLAARHPFQPKSQVKNSIRAAVGGKKRGRLAVRVRENGRRQRQRLRLCLIRLLLIIGAVTAVQLERQSGEGRVVVALHDGCRSYQKLSGKLGL